MSITVLNYLDQTLVNNVAARAAERAEAAAYAASVSQTSYDSDFSTVLNETSQSYATTQNTSSGTGCPEDLSSIFEEAASRYGVSADLLKSIAKAESGFNANAVSHAGAVGIMQLMPQTAASLGVSNSYDPRENIMGGAKLISQLLTKYNGDTSLALAAYNAGSGNVDKYGGIPPFTETQNYVKKVLSYLAGANSAPADNSSAFNLTGSARDEANEALQKLFTSKDISKGSLDFMAAMLMLSQVGSSNDAAETDTVTADNSVTAENTPNPVPDTSPNDNSLTASSDDTLSTGNTDAGTENDSSLSENTTDSIGTDSSVTGSPAEGTDAADTVSEHMKAAELFEPPTQDSISA